MHEKMTQDQRLDYLVKAFKEDSGKYRSLQPPADAEGKRILLRSLMNIRMPRKLPDDVLAIQDEYLIERNAEKGIVHLSDIPMIRDGLSLWQGDITRLAVDAIVNAANSQMLGCWVPGHHCIDNAIHTYAGVQLRIECARLMDAQGGEEPTGQAKVTSAYNLPARRIIHTVGPIANGCPTARHRAELASCYRSCLDAAAAEGLRSIAFCCISTGIFGFPQKEAAAIAVRTVRAWLAETGTEMVVVFNVFGEKDERLYRALLGL